MYKNALGVTWKIMASLSSRLMRGLVTVLALLFPTFASAQVSTEAKGVRLFECTTEASCLSVSSERALSSHMQAFWALDEGQMEFHNWQVGEPAIQFDSGYWNPQEDYFKLENSHQEWLVFPRIKKIMSFKKQL